MEINRPSQKKQSSRKGKRSWRKNIDIDDIEVALEEKREQIRTHGEVIDKIDSQELFTVDVAGDEKLKKKAVKPYKVTKSAEILAERSKAPGLQNAHKKSDNKIQGVKKREIHKLMKLAGRVQGESVVKTVVENDGLVKGKAYDVWGDEEDEIKTKVPKPEILEKTSIVGWTVAKKAPKTLKKEPERVKEIEKIPHAGKSYNPSLESWKSLLNKEYTTEKEREDKRLELQAYQEKIQNLIKNMDDKEEEEDEHSEEEEDEEEDEETNQNPFSLSINRPVVLKKKTKAQRNRQKKHQERVKLEEELKLLKQQLQELQKIDQYNNELKTSVPNTPKIKKNKKHRLGSKHSVIQDSLEIKLSDELTDSLRTLKPEGNLFYDQMRVLQGGGKIESRIPFSKKRKYAPKITEKWAYKDFK